MASDKVPFFPSGNTRIVEPNSDKQIVTVPLEKVEWGGRTTSIKQVGGVKNSMTLEHVKSKG
jgi:hypothetical protein